jgi:PAS domain S-box-containing protein
MLSNKIEIPEGVPVRGEYTHRGFVSLFKDKYFWYIFTLTIIFLLLIYAPFIITLTEWNTIPDNGSIYLVAFYRTIYIIISIITTWKYGVKAGLIICLILAPVIFLSYILNLQKETSIFLDIGVVVLGVIFSLLIGKNLDFQKLLQKNTENLQMQTVALSQEIAEREKAEDEVRRSEKRYRLLAENATDVIWIVDFSSQEKATYISPSISRLLGYSVEEAMAKNMSEVVGPIPYDIAKNTFQKVFSSDLSLQNSKTFFTIELELNHRNGTFVPVEVNCNLICENNEKATGILIIARDIHERKQAEDKIKNVAEEWRTTFDSISSMISIHDKNYRIVRVNKAFANNFKMKPQDLIGKYCYEIFHHTKESINNCPHRITMDTHKNANMEIYLSDKEKYFQISTSPMFDKNGEFTGSVHITRDVTERKQMEQQLIMSDRLASIGELVSGVAHELNNPLTSIIGYSQLIIENNPPSDIKSDLDVIHGEAQRAAEIVKNLLTFARKHAPVKQLGKINNVIDGVLKLRAYEQKVNNININTDYATDLPEIMIDHFQMQQVFLNIIINAEYAMLSAHKKGILKITTQHVDNRIIIKFIDDGPGISKKDMPRIFSPFFTTKEVGKGTGLGLSICHGIMTEHNGKIYAESEHGKGSTFILELPINMEQIPNHSPQQN